MWWSGELGNSASLTKGLDDIGWNAQVFSQGGDFLLKGRSGRVRGKAGGVVVHDYEVDVGWEWFVTHCHPVIPLLVPFKEVSNQFWGVYIAHRFPCVVGR